MEPVSGPACPIFTTPSSFLPQLANPSTASAASATATFLCVIPRCFVVMHFSSA
jgi:hypothetical protein